MASLSKYIKLHANLLLEWVYDTDSLQQENYNVVNNLNIGNRGYVSQSAANLNTLSNTVFPVDPVLKKYALVDTAKYNFLKLETYTTSYVQFDKFRLHLPTSYSFDDNDQVGLYVRVYTYDYVNEKTFDLCSFLYDDTVTNSYITLNEEFSYDEQSWGKYIEIKIPSADAVSKQRTSSVAADLPLNNSINLNLTKANGLSLTSPIFVEFSYANNKETVLGNTYFYFGDINTSSLSKVPEYQDLAANIEESTDGDYFELWGSYTESNESLDDFVDELKAKGRIIKIEYDVTLYEENILMDQITFTVTENFSKKLKYRPILSFTNTTAAIDVEMKVIDLVDNSTISRFASVGLRNNLFKYGKTLTKIDVSNAYNPKLYNLKTTNSTSFGIETTQIPDIQLTKVNYPVITEREKILASSSSTKDSEYKSMGLSEIIINPFGNVIKFMIANDIDDDGTATPYDLAKISENSTFTLSFKSDDDFLEKNLWRETDENDFENGVIVFKIEEDDLPLMNKIAKDNKNYYITVKSNKTGVRSLLYSGTWINYTDVTFVEGETSNVSGSDITDFTDQIGTEIITDTTLSETPTAKIENVNNNLLVFLNADANIATFDSYLNTIKVTIYLRKPAGNTTSLVYLYLLLNVTDALFEDIKLQEGVDEVIKLSFDLGKGITDTAISNESLDNIRNKIIQFNCNT